MTTQVCTYDFTASCEKYTKGEIEDVLKEHCKKWCFQQETGDGGFQHFQGRFSLKVKKRLCEAVKLMGLNWHLSATSSANRDNNFYVTKPERTNGPWSDKDEPPAYVPRQIREIQELYPWQQAIVDDRNTWNTRTVNLVICHEGNTGKSTLAQWIAVKGLGRMLPMVNDFRDFMRIVMGTKKERLYIIDIPRSLKKDKLYQFMAGIETLKNGYAYDDRYKFKEEHFDAPNVWVFMNIVPELSYLSMDRWRLWQITEDRTLTKYSGFALMGS